MTAIDTSKPTMDQLILSGPIGPLEAMLESSADAVARVVVVCHPHPLYGGNMHNKVVHTLARAFTERGGAALRFNYRGVGISAGSYDEGIGETQDTLAVLDWVTQRWPGIPVYLAGFSFGGAMAIRAATQRRIERLVTVAPAIERLGTDPAVPDCPWLLIQGTADELLDAAATARWVASLPRPPQLVMLDGVSHFFHGQLTRLKDVVAQWLWS